MSEIDLLKDKCEVLIDGLRQLDSKYRKMEKAAKDMSLGLEEISLMRHGSGMSRAAKTAEAALFCFRDLDVKLTKSNT